VKASNLDEQDVMPPPNVGNNKHISRKMVLKEKSWNPDKMATQRNLELLKSNRFQVITIDQQRKRRKKKSRKDK
jgi:hypothetical protein